MSTLERAIAIAAGAHAGHKNKAGEPYILHPLRVMLAVDGEEARIAAVLHDVIEESSLTLDELRQQGFSDAVVRAVEALTHGDKEDYFDAVRRAAQNPLARQIKIADLQDNIAMSRTIGDNEKLKKYEQALRMIEKQEFTSCS